MPTRKRERAQPTSAAHCQVPTKTPRIRSVVVVLRGLPLTGTTDAATAGSTGSTRPIHRRGLRRRYSVGAAATHSTANPSPCPTAGPSWRRPVSPRSPCNGPAQLTSPPTPRRRQLLLHHLRRPLFRNVRHRAAAASSGRRNWATVRAREMSRVSPGRGKQKCTAAVAVSRPFVAVYTVCVCALSLAYYV